MNPGSSAARTSATIGGSPPIAARTSGDAPTATIRPPRTATASAYGRATSIVTTSPSKMNAHASSPATPKTLRAFSSLDRLHARSARVPAARSAGVGGARAHLRRLRPPRPAGHAELVRRRPRLLEQRGPLRAREQQAAELVAHDRQEGACVHPFAERHGRAQAGPRPLPAA